ncbi:MAG TPA: tRNA adenosine(34) deaminase TadA [Firmicutes bacterium]|nr:tRNA adenosine(34) deaminase TadA [Bacillota bacterium]
MEKDEIFMRMAIQQAEQAAALGEVPVGAVVIRNEEVIASGHNLRETQKNGLYHAELIALHRACGVLGGWRLPGCTLYVTLEPCPMCMGAAINTRIARVVFGASDPKAGTCGSLFSLTAYPVNHKPEITGGILEEECRLLLQSFFRKLRNSD